MPATIPQGIGRRIADMFRDEMDKAVRDLAEATLQKARADAPPDPPEGEDPDPAVSLRDSGRVEKVRPGVYEIVFDVPYAAKQHEAQQFAHPHGGGSKYLEKNVQLAARELEGRIASSVVAITRRKESGTIRVGRKDF